MAQKKMSQFVEGPRQIVKLPVAERFEQSGRVDRPLESLEDAGAEASRCINGGCGDPGCSTSGCAKHHDIPERQKDIAEARELKEAANALPDDDPRKGIWLANSRGKIRSAHNRTEKPGKEIEGWGPYNALEGTGPYGVYGGYCPQDGEGENALCGVKCSTSEQVSGHDRIAIGELERYIDRQAWHQHGQHEDGRPRWESEWHARYTEKTLDARAGVLGLGNGGSDALEGLMKHGFAFVKGYDRFSRPGGTYENMVPLTKTDEPWTFARWFDHHIEHSGLEIELGVDVGQASIYKYAIGLHELVAKDDLDVMIICTGATKDKAVRTVRKGAEHIVPATLALQYQSDLDHGIVRSAADHEKYAAGEINDVIGAGDTGMDLGRSLRRQIQELKARGAKLVRVHYYKPEEQLRTSLAELNYAKEEGVEFVFESAVVEVNGNGDGTFELVSEVGPDKERKSFTTNKPFSAVGVQPEQINERFQLAALGADIQHWHRMIIPPPDFDRVRNPHGLRYQANDERIQYKAGYLGDIPKPNGKVCSVFVGGDWQEPSLGILAAAGARKAANMAFQKIAYPEQFRVNAEHRLQQREGIDARELHRLRTIDGDNAARQIETLEKAVRTREEHLVRNANGIPGMGLAL